MSENTTKSSSGRPTGYQNTYPEILLDLMSKGQKGALLYSHFGITRKCFWEWRKRYPEFNEAYEKGEEACQTWWENFGLQKMLEGDEKGYKYWKDFMHNNFNWNKQMLEARNTTVNVNNMQINTLQSKDDLIKYIQTELEELNVIDATFEQMPEETINTAKELTKGVEVDLNMPLPKE